ncbi:MAG: DUF2079 domain-containing protein [Clostridia bacterium]|nr:DUF2079 domain-containing protein [Clostridia bacterium]
MTDIKALFNNIKRAAGEAEFSFGDLFASFAFAFIVASFVFCMGGDFRDLAYVRQYPLWIPVLICFLGTAFAVTVTLLLKTKGVLAWLLVTSATVFSIVLVTVNHSDIYFNIGVSAVLILVAKYASDGDKLGLSKIKLSDRQTLIITAVLVCIFTAAVYILTAAKYKAFYHSAFDFGIFCQAFEGMAETGLPYTTIERSEYLSHFAVHFSPFFYLLLPGYFLWRSPLYLLFCQALGIALGAFPVRRICKDLGFSNGASLGAVGIYLLFPTMANGCYYDFHENKFLAVLILWLVCFAIEKRPLGIIIFAFLVLTVKEDAFIYVIAVCLWMIVTKRNRLLALILAVVSVGWFFFACSMIQLSGGEIMTGRFSNYTSGEGGSLFDAVRTCFIDIGFLLREVFSGADTEAFREMTYTGQKMEFVLWTCVPLLFTPFLKKRPSELILLLPLLVINLMPSWMYQYDVDFQYTYGTATLLILSAFFFAGELSANRRRGALCCMLILSAVFATSLISPKIGAYCNSYYGNKEKYDATQKALEMIPEDASVTAYGYIVPHLWYVDDLRTCPEYYKELAKTDYYIVDVRYDYDKFTEEMYETMADDYSLVKEEGYIKIYKRGE